MMTVMLVTIAVVCWLLYRIERSERRFFERLAQEAWRENYHLKAMLPFTDAPVHSRARMVVTAALRSQHRRQG